MAKKNPIRIGLVGLGRAGWGMHRRELEARGRKSKFKVVAVCDTIKARRDMAAEHFGCRAYRTIEDLLKDADVELVDIATRTKDHAPHSRLALKAGKDVFLEKPIAVSYQEAVTLKKAAKRSKGELYIRHNRRFEAAFVHIQEIIASGVLGDVFNVKLRRGGFQRRRDWQTLIDHGGGQLLNWGPHVVDHGLRLLGAPVADMWSNLRLVAALGDAEDHLKVVLRGTNGCVVDLQISGGAIIHEPEWQVMGTRGGVCSVDGNRLRVRYLDPKVKLARARARVGTPPVGSSFGNKETLKWVDKTIPVKPRRRTSPAAIWDHLYAAMRDGVPFPITMDEALETMRVISEVKKGTPFVAK